MKKYETLIFNDTLLNKLYNNCPEEIKRKLVIKKVPANYVLIEKEEEVNSVFILVSGQFDVFKLDDKDNTMTYLSNEPPCFAGILEIFSGGKIANATVRTGKESLIIIIDGTDFKNWIEHDFESYRLVCTNFVKDMYHTLNDFDPMQLPKGKNLLMQYFSCNYRDEIMQNGQITIKFSEESFSSTLNMDIESLKNNISILVHEQLICMSDNTVNITAQQLGRIESFLLHNRTSHQIN